MCILSKREYEKIVEALRRDVSFALSLGFPKETVLAIWRQEHIRKTKKKFHKVKEMIDEIVKLYDSGMSIEELSKMLDFSQINLLRLILKRKGLSKREIKRIVESVECEEPVYSKKEIERIREIGKRKEDELEDFLRKNGIRFERMRKDGPDFLIEHQNYAWIESKAKFASFYQISEDKKKLLKYFEEYGPGIALYWFGRIEGVRLQGVEIVCSLKEVASLLGFEAV